MVLYIHNVVFAFEGEYFEIFLSYLARTADGFWFIGNRKETQVRLKYIIGFVNKYQINF